MNQPASKESKAEPASLKDQARNVLEEARMVLPGIQALFGFQLIAVFNQRFELMRSELQIVHLIAVALVTIAVALVMAPAAYHRIAERHQVSTYFVNLASMFIAGGMIPLALGVALDLFVIGELVTESRPVGVALGVFTLVLCSSLWFVFPIIRRNNQRRSRRATT